MQTLNRISQSACDRRRSVVSGTALAAGSYPLRGKALASGWSMGGTRPLTTALSRAAIAEGTDRKRRGHGEPAASAVPRNAEPAASAVPSNAEPAASAVPLTEYIPVRFDRGTLTFLP